MKFRKMMGCIALGLTCAMIGAGATMRAQNTSAAAEAVTAANSTTTVVTSRSPRRCSRCVTAWSA